MTGSDFIPFALPDIGEEEINEVVHTLRNNWLTTGPKTLQFEKEFSEFLSVKHALAVNSATSGLHLALEAIGINSGDKVVVPVNTFTATAEVVRYLDADPIFCDIDASTFNLDPEKLNEIISNHPDRRKIKAVIPVHIGGQSCDMEKIFNICRPRGIKIVEDAAHAFPATYQGKYIGTLSDITVFSFYATKTLCTGEGGMITTNSEEWAQRMKTMRLHGMSQTSWNRHQSTSPSWNYSVIAPGFKYNLTDLASSMGIHQLRKARSFREKRAEIASLYDEAFRDTSIKTPFVLNKSDLHSWHLYIAKVSKRDEFIEKMFSMGVGTSVHFIPLHLQPFWKEKYRLSPEDFPVATANFQEIVSLPIYSSLSFEQVKKIITSAQIASG